MKKWTSLVLAMLMLCLSVTGALAELSANTNATGFPIVNEKETFTIYTGRQVLDLSEGNNTKIAEINAEAKTNIHIEWIESTNTTEQVNLMLASGEMPDAFLASLSESQVLANKSRFIPLQDLIENYMPNYKAMYDEYNLWDIARADDGNIYTLLTAEMFYQESGAGGIPMVDSDWLNAVGMDMPTTLDEYYDMLVAFKTQDPNGNGMQDEIPIIFCQNDWCTHFMELGGSWGFTDYQKVENGKFIMTPVLPEFRSFLEFFSKCYAEGLIDPEGFSQSMQQWITKWREGKVGICYIWTANACLPEDEAATWKVLRPVDVPDYDVTPVVSGRKDAMHANRYGFAITSSCKNPEALARWVDAQNVDTETKMTWRLGERGKLWDWAEDGSVLTLYPESTETMGIENMKYTWAHVNMAPVLHMPHEIEKPDATISPAGAVRWQMVDEVYDLLPDTGTPYRTPPEDKLEEREMIWVELKAYLDNFVATSVINGVTDESWAAHLAACEMYGLYEYQQWWQDFMDGKF